RRCVEEGRVLLDDRVDQHVSGAPEPSATFRQLLSHTSVAGDGLVYSYRPNRIDILASVVSGCTGQTFRSATAGLLEHQAMVDSVPGADAAPAPPSPGDASASATQARYLAVLQRLATPYAVDSQGRATPSRYPATALSASTGLITTARDLARFDLAIKK